ncbi:MAG: zf-HC2 domain-containing protein [Candidatus Marinimicrobia bacterium]|nr:zf-HC2 domain-containing protein [Candidatus Neomarinimicrobiota bacterium]
MAEALYGDLGSRTQARFDEHLQGCSQCAGMFLQFQQTLAITDRRELARADEESMQGFWERLEPHLGRTPATPAWRLAPLRLVLTDWANRPALAAAAALLLVAVGIFIGRINPANYGGVQAQAAAVLSPALTAEFNEQFGHYLERTKMILLGMDNYQLEEGTSGDNLDHQRAISRELLAQGRDLKAHAAISSNASVGYLIDDIERILLQLANSDDGDLELTVEIIQSGMQRNGIMLKINLTQIGRIHREQREIDPKTSSVFVFYGKDRDDG